MVVDGVVTGLVIGKGESAGFAEGTVTAGVALGLGVTVVGLVEGTVTIIGGGLVAGKTVPGVVGEVVIEGCISSC